MGVNASKVKYQLDVDAGVTLRNIADGAESSTATEASVSLKELDNAYWHSNEIPHGVFAVAVHVSELDVAGTNAYVLSLLVDDAPTMNDSPVTIASYTITAPGFYTFFVDSKNIPVLDPDTSGTDKWLAIRATLSGDSTPEITYGAWIAKNVRP